MHIDQHVTAKYHVIGATLEHRVTVCRIHRHKVDQGLEVGIDGDEALFGRQPRVPRLRTTEPQPPGWIKPPPCGLDGGGMDIHRINLNLIRPKTHTLQHRRNRPRLFPRRAGKGQNS